MGRSASSAHAHARRAPIRHTRPDISGIDVRALAAALHQAVEGEVRFGVQARALYSTDSSNYREVPIGVVIPKSREDVEKAVAVCRRFGAPITSRGCGTSLAGQCCNLAVVIDFSKYVDRILELDPEARTAWVEPGCVLDVLRSAAGEHGLTFGPDPSTHDHCTLGGMVGNDACGVHSVMAGRTADNIEALEVLTYDGEKMIVGATDEDELEHIIEEGGRRGEIYRGMRTVRDAHADAIRESFPEIPRRVSGFNLDELLPEKGFHVARALVGSEGTCATVLRVKCRLVPKPPARVLLVLGYADVYAAADAVPRILGTGPIGLEGIDEQLTEYMRAKDMKTRHLSLLPEGAGWLFVEFGGDTREEAESRARKLMDALAGDHGTPSMNLLTDPDEQSSLWEIREAGLPATSHVPGMHETHPGWEDAAVPPDKVGRYLRDFRQLLDEFGYHCSLYGHFGDGCIHCRIDFDLSTDEGLARYGRFIDRAADLVVSYGGSLSGEHGDGEARGALLDKMYGDRVVGAFRSFKEIWDPDCRMNPGKVVAAPEPTAALRRELREEPASPEIRFALPQDEGDFAGAASRCVGVGDCRKHDSGVMCPSYMATREEAYSTRGRARLLYEMALGDVIEDGWRSDAVHEALDFCLACKGCRSECPVHVDMAAYKAEFMYHYYKGRLRPRSAYSMGLIWWWSRLGSMMPSLSNAISQTPPFSNLAKRLGGFAPDRRIPPFANPDFRTWFKRRQPRGGGDGPERRVLLWPDTFNGYLTTEPLKATVAVLEDAGWRVEIPSRPLCCGRPLYAHGFLGLADRLWRRTLATLRPVIQAGMPVVGLEPSCVAAFRDELMQMFPENPDAQQLSKRTFTLGELLMQAGYEPPPLEGKALVHAHCHHHAVMGAQSEVDLLKKTGMEVELLDDGCCGMAGDYGFRAESRDIAMRVGERAFLPRVRAADDAHFVADGFSCREQALQATGRRLTTLPELLRAGTARD